MIFFHAMPGLFGGFGNYLIPIYNAASEVAFPRINGLSLILLPVSYACLLMSIISEMGVGTGWTLYPPLSTTYLSMSIDFILSGLVISGLSTFMSSINFVTTIYQIRSKGLILSTLPIISWAFSITSILLIITLPVLTGSILMLLSDIHINTTIFTGNNGDPVLFQHLFWFFGHPEVYILILPAFAIISQVISSSYQKIIFGYHSMILAMFCIGILGSLVWAHHLFTVGLEVDTRAYFTAVTILVSLPTGTKVFNWLSTYMGSNNPSFTSSQSILALIFIVMFTLGGTTGVVLGNGAIDIALHDTYYVIGHFHFVLSIGAVIGILTGLFNYQSHFLGPTLAANTSKILFTLIFLTGILLTFIPMHFLGFHVMPRRIPDYPDYFNSWNALSSIGSTLTIFSLLFLAFTTSIRSNSILKRSSFSYGRISTYYSNTILLYSSYITAIILTSSIIFHYNMVMLAFLYSIRESYYFLSNVSIFVYGVILSEFLLFTAYFWAYYHLYSTLPGIIYPSTNSLVLMIVIILSNLSIQYNSLLSITLAIIFTSLQYSY
jgi:cytochrome c oxidase subunit 1